MTERMTAAEFNHMHAVGSTGKTPETLLKEVCTTWLAMNGWQSYAWFQQGMVPTSLKGMPDRIAIKGGQHVWIEFKAGKNKLRPAQELRKAELEAAGAIVLVVHTLDELIEELEKRGL